jgi:hypothetical protein
MPHRKLCVHTCDTHAVYAEELDKFQSLVEAAYDWDVVESPPYIIWLSSHGPDSDNANIEDELWDLVVMPSGDNDGRIEIYLNLSDNGESFKLGACKPAEFKSHMYAIFERAETMPSVDPPLRIETLVARVLNESQGDCCFNAQGAATHELMQELFETIW